MFRIITSFYEGLTNMRPVHCRKEKKMRHTMEDYKVDNMIDDSFPASDPPSTY